MVWFVYIIKCVDGSLYTGYTDDLQKRFEKHKIGKGSKYTRSHHPEKIVFFERHYKKIIALRREREIKSWPRKEKIEFIKNKNPSG
jgi:putative endonuclease